MKLNMTLYGYFVIMSAFEPIHFAVTKAVPEENTSDGPWQLLGKNASAALEILLLVVLFTGIGIAFCYRKHACNLRKFSRGIM